MLSKESQWHAVVFSRGHGFKPLSSLTWECIASLSKSDLSKNNINININISYRRARAYSHNIQQEIQRIIRALK